jgi:SSS family transporter
MEGMIQQVALGLGTLGASRFGAWDWAVVVAYLGLLLVSGVWLARREPAGASEYFLAGRRMPAWAVAFSIIASSLSVATFVGVPELAYRGDMTYLSTNVGGLLAVVVVAFVFIPAFYKHDVTSIYELLERRFGVGAKRAASGAFMVGRVFASGARVYIGAIPLALVLFGPEKSEQAVYLAGAIAVLTSAAVLYTLVGGIASVIWTDVIQVVVLLGAVIAGIVLLINRIPATGGEIVEALRHGASDGGSKLTAIRVGLDVSKPGLGFDPSENFTLLTAVFGFSLLNLAAYGTDHDMVQRMLTCKNAIAGGRSVLSAIALSVPIVTLFLVTGLLLWALDHARLSQPVGLDSAPRVVGGFKSERVFVNFILNDMPRGLSGVMVAGLFAVGLGSLNSAINAMAATLMKDFYMPARVGKSERHYLRASRWAVAGWGAVLGGFAVLCIFWKRANPETTLIDFALGVMTFAYAGLLAVFLTALLTKRGSTASVIAGLVVGFVVVLLLQPYVWGRWTAWITWSVPSTDGTAMSRNLAGVKIAYPWHMLIGTACAFGVCCLGKSKEKRSRRVDPPARA